MTEEPLEAAREAIRQHEWDRGLELFQRADATSTLEAEDLELMAEAAWWAARPEEEIEALERAYAAHMQGGNQPRAAYAALILSREHASKIDGSLATGWFERARKLLENEPEAREHGYLSARHSLRELHAGNFDEALDAARRTGDIGRRTGDRNLEAFGHVYEGMILVEKGEVARGMALIDQGALAAVAGELTPMAAGAVYCNTIGTCNLVADYQRAGEWADAQRRWCERQGITGWPGDCRVHQAEILAMRGAWAEAEESARRGAEELRKFNRLTHVAEALYQIGELRLRVGDFQAAEDAFRDASELGRDPQPGLSLLLMERGNLDAAWPSITRALDEESSSELSRARFLPAYVQIGLAGGHVDAASAAADELGAIAARFEVPALRAAAHSARGAVGLARGEVADATRTLRRAVSLWRDVVAPYEVARARSLLGQAISAQGDEEGGRLELQSARSAFDQLGAAPDVRRIDGFLEPSRAADSEAGRPRDVRTYLFTDMVRSTNLVEAIGDDAWVDLLRWHDQTLRDLFARHGGQEIDHAGDGFFVVFERPEDGISCAVAIQRTLADHRRKYGFAPSVRIGVHSAPATKSGGAYVGKGVHEAARIASAAGAGEIVASVQSLEGHSELFVVTNTREVTLKGVEKPIEVATLDWRAVGQGHG